MFSEKVSKSFINDIDDVPQADIDAAAKASTKPEWLRRLDEGSEFNKSQSVNYDYNEVYIEKPDGSGYYRLDSYDLDKGEIVSRKNTDLSKIQQSTAVAYIKEIEKKYPVGATIADVPSTKDKGLIPGTTLIGRKILEVPVQNNGIPSSVIDAAREANVIIRDINGRVY